MSKTEALDPALLATMSPEERAEIEGADDAEVASLAAVGAEKDPVHKGGDVAAADAGDDSDDSDDSATAEQVDDAAATAAAPAAAPAEADAAATADAAPVAQPAYRFMLPDDYEARVAAAKTAIEEAGERFDAGELTREEYQRAVVAASAEQRELDRIATKYEIAVESQQQAQEQARQAALGRLFVSAKAGGVDYLADKGKMRDLDTFVRALAADEANEDKPLEWFLEEGHKRVRMLHGIADAGAPAPASAPAAAPAKTPAEIKAAATAARKTDLGAAPATLAQVPGGDGAGDVGDEFDDVMSLDGDAFEAAISRMAKTQPERFARFQASKQ